MTLCQENNAGRKTPCNSFLLSQLSYRQSLLRSIENASCCLYFHRMTFFSCDQSCLPSFISIIILFRNYVVTRPKLDWFVIRFQRFFFIFFLAEWYCPIVGTGLCRNYGSLIAPFNRRRRHQTVFYRSNSCTVVWIQRYDLLRERYEILDPPYISRKKKKQCINITIDYCQLIDLFYRTVPW
jgi:hypothetical protein